LSQSTALRVSTYHHRFWRRKNVNERSISTALVGGLLVLLGVFFLFLQLVPGFSRILRIDLFWPLIVVAAGGLMLVLGLATRTPDLAVPASIVGGIGLLLFYQNVTGDWASWAYAWALIPGFVGVGVILARLLGGRPEGGIQGGGTLILISLVMFLVFGAFLGPFGALSALWPLLLILGGVLLLGRSLLQRRS
jgi:hypothetical protein